MARRGWIIATARRATTNDHENWISHSADEGRIPENPGPVHQGRDSLGKVAGVDRYSRDFAVATCSRSPLLRGKSSFRPFSFSLSPVSSGTETKDGGKPTQGGCVHFIRMLSPRLLIESIAPGDD